MIRPKAPEKMTRHLYQEVFSPSLSKSDLRRSSIIEAAIRTYARLGIEYVSYEDIAREARTSRPLVLHYFPEKRELFLMAMKLIRAQLQLLAIESMDLAGTAPAERFEAYVRACFEWPERHPEHAQAWLLFFYHCAGDPELREEHRRITAMGQERLEALIDSLGVKPSGAWSSRELAKAVQAQITGGFIEALSERAVSDYPAVSRMTLDACLRMLGLKKVKSRPSSRRSV